MFSVWKFMNRGIQSPERLIYPPSSRERECHVCNGHNQWVSINGYQWVISLNLLLPTTKDAVQAVSTLRHPWPKIFTEGWLVDVFGEGSSRTDAVAVLTPLPCLTPQVCNTTENIVTLGQTQFSWIFTGHVLAVKHLIKPLNPFESYRFILQTAVPYGFI